MNRVFVRVAALLFLGLMLRSGYAYAAESPWNNRLAGSCTSLARGEPKENQNFCGDGVCDAQYEDDSGDEEKDCIDCYGNEHRCGDGVCWWPYEDSTGEPDVDCDDCYETIQDPLPDWPPSPLPIPLPAAPISH